MIGLVQVGVADAGIKHLHQGYRSDAAHAARKERRQWRVRRLRRSADCLNGFAFSKLYFPAVKCLPPDHFQQMLGITGTLHINLRNRAFDIAQIGGRQLDARAA